MSDVRSWFVRLTALLIAVFVVPACAVDAGDDEEEETDPIAEDAQALVKGKVIVSPTDIRRPPSMPRSSASPSTQVPNMRSIMIQIVE